MCIAVFGLVGAVSAEATIEQIMNDTYGSGGWSEVTTTDEYTFTSGGYTATTIIVNKSSAYANPTGWYEVGTSPLATHELFNPVVEGDCNTFTTTREFGMYINSDEGQFVSEKSVNSDSSKHVRLFTISGGYVLAFEDKNSTTWSGIEPDYQDIVVELKGANLVPEFTTIALPAVSLLGLFLYFNHRKRRKE
jgi:hypothetical protein